MVTATSANTPYVINTIFGTSINQYVLGQAAGNNSSHNGTLQSWSEFMIGCQASESWNGDISEVIVFNTAVNEAQRIIIDNHLAAKYGFVLAANDLYNEDDASAGNYDFDVAGIGRANSSSMHTDAQCSIVRINDPSNLDLDNEYYFWGHDNGPLTATTAGLPGTVSERITRIWKGSETGNVGSVDVSFDMTGFGPFAASDLRLLISGNDDTDFTDAGDFIISGAVHSGGNIYAFQNATQLTDNRRFTVGIASGILPVELLKFEARGEERTVVLTWSTASEVNNDYFTIERSSDGRTFEAVATVAGAGTAREKNQYEFIDTAPFSGRSYYRLSQTDFDGTTERFPLVSVDVPTAETGFAVFPNPTTNGEFGIEVRNAVGNMTPSVAVFDLQGVQVFSKEPQQTGGTVDTTFHFNPQHPIRPGIYVLKITYDDKLYTERLVVK